MNTFIWIMGFALLSLIVNSVGIIAIFKHRQWAEKAKNLVMCFAAGVLISSALTLALPKSIKYNFNAGFVALFGFLFMYFSNELIRIFTREKELAFGLTAAEGIGIHSLVDGIIYTVTFNVSIVMGFLAASGLVIHEFAEGIITYLILLKGGVSKKIAGLYAFMISGLSTPIGALVVYPFVRRVGESTLGLMLGFVAGVLLYVSAAHLLPEAREHKHSIPAFLCGIGLALFIAFTHD